MKRAILLLGFIFTMTFAGASSAQQSSQPTLDQLKAQKFMVTTLDGKRISLNQLLQEGRPVVFDFWATWCGPCRQEIPHLNEMDKKHGKNGLVMIGLNLENPAEDRQAVKDFVNRYNMGYQNVFAPREIYQFFNGGATNYRVPQTIVFGADGKMIKRMVGYSPNVGRAALNNAIEQAMRSREIGAR